MYLSIKNTLPRSKLIELLYSKYYKYTWVKYGITHDEEVRNKLIVELHSEIRSLVE
jgi:hypothetical protein